MTALVIIFILVMLPLGIILRLRNMSMVLGALVLICVVLSLYHLFAGGPGSILFFAGPAALALMLGWTAGKWVGGRG
ncbi:MAG: hypothetical protein AB3N17_19585 [Tateyamaria sp.]